jgi:NAD+ diphosphatase
VTSPELTGCAPLDHLALARGTVDRVTRRRTDKDWIDAAWKDPRTRVLVVHDGHALVHDQQELVFVAPQEAPAGTRFLLGEDTDGTVYFGVSAPLGPVSPGVRATSLREVGALLSDRDAGLLTHAVALANWHDTHLRCPLDGTPTVPDAAGHSAVCPKDGSEHFPRTDPAVIMLVTDPEDRCLLARNAAWPTRRVSILAGFVEPGESAEQAVIREVAEETGITALADAAQLDARLPGRRPRGSGHHRRPRGTGRGPLVEPGRPGRRAAGRRAGPAPLGVDRPAHHRGLVRRPAAVHMDPAPFLTLNMALATPVRGRPAAQQRAGYRPGVARRPSVLPLAST